MAESIYSTKQSSNRSIASVRQRARIYEQRICAWKSGEWDGTSPCGELSDYIRKYMLGKHNNSCAQCGWNSINPTHGNCPVQIEHIDGNSANNLESNLTVLCPNCHSLTATYGALNKGRGRFARRMRDRNHSNLLIQ